MKVLFINVLSLKALFLKVLSLKVLRLLLFVAVVGLLLSDVIEPILIHLSDKNWIALYLQQEGITGYAFLFFATFMFVFIGGPRQINGLLYGYLLGAFNGMLFAVVVSLVAASMNYWLAHYLFSHWLRTHFTHKIYTFQLFCQRKPFYKILLLRLFPVGSNLLTNVFCGGIGIKYFPFISASAVGYIPQTLIFSLIGAGINTLNNQLVYLSLVLFGMSLLITRYLYRDHMKSIRPEI
ncbi:VTT domain-containing protein [uncultured Shewanella sp.]|uniref:TVP38/TMEM64 family protein n=1 Tax=uncultured Shewanella sp. TaxID=173975 RepID=UPI00262A044A|nr:VTT domain-containing protein [uncultured Shewanella sp.]